MASTDPPSHLQTSAERADYQALQGSVAAGDPLEAPMRQESVIKSKIFKEAARKDYNSDNEEIAKAHGMVVYGDLVEATPHSTPLGNCHTYHCSETSHCS